MKIFGRVNVMTLIVRWPLYAVLLSMLVVGDLHASEWQEVSRNTNLKIYIRHRADSPIEEVRGIGEFNTPIAILKAILADVAKYSEFMPYTKESRVLPQNA
jgi:Polyketide cyclase / dehydrase and lipid transport